MADRHRLNDEPFTCCNRSFRTDTSKGYSHGSLGTAGGSVFDRALVEGGHSMWLEYVTNEEGSTHVFWLMWYDLDGSPLIPLSGVITANQLRDMSARLAAFIELS